MDNVKILINLLLRLHPELDEWVKLNFAENEVKE